jgi:ParB/Sulfiredoxin domain
MTPPSIEYMQVSALKPYGRNARTHSKKQIRQVANSIKRFGFTNPVLVSDEGEIIAGHCRVEAAKLLGMSEVPTLRLSHLSPAERRAYILADNKLAENAGWDSEILAWPRPCSPPRSCHGGWGDVGRHFHPIPPHHSRERRRLRARRCHCREGRRGRGDLGPFCICSI